MLSVPSPTPKSTPRPGTSPTLDELRVVAPAAAARGELRVHDLVRAHRLLVDMPVMTPSEACVSNCTWWMCMLALEKPANRSRRLLAGERHRDAVADVGADRQRLGRLACRRGRRPCSWRGRRSCRSGRRPGVGDLDRSPSIATTLNVRTARRPGRSRRCAWPTGSGRCRGRGAAPSRRAMARRSGRSARTAGVCPMCVRISGNAGRPLIGSNRMSGRLPDPQLPSVARIGRRVPWVTSGRSGPRRRSGPRARRGRRARSDRVGRPASSRPRRPWLSGGTPCGGQLRADPVVQVGLGDRGAVGHRTADQAGRIDRVGGRGAVRQGREVGLLACCRRARSPTCPTT